MLPLPYVFMYPVGWLHTSSILHNSCVFYYKFLLQYIF